MNIKCRIIKDDSDELNIRHSEEMNTEESSSVAISIVTSSEKDLIPKTEIINDYHTYKLHETSKPTQQSNEKEIEEVKQERKELKQQENENEVFPSRKFNQHWKSHSTHSPTSEFILLFFFPNSDKS